MQVRFKRPDGTFVAEVNGLPYHVVPGDDLYAKASEIGANAPDEPVLAPDPDEPPVLTKVQWGTFLDMTGFRAAADAALAGMPRRTPSDVQKWALMKNVISESDYYRLDTALALVSQVRAAFPGLELPTEKEVLDAWNTASKLSVQNLLG